MEEGKGEERPEERDTPIMPWLLTVHLAMSSFSQLWWAVLIGLTEEGKVRRSMSSYK